VRHGLTAETIIPNLEDVEDYKAFEATVIADYGAETAVARELVLRLASLLWRLRRATAIETQLFAIETDPPLGGNPEPIEVADSDVDLARRTRQLTGSFLRLASLDSAAFERLNRYETALWRQAVQIIFALHPIQQR
jgi:hypothetical protein